MKRDFSIEGMTCGNCKKHVEENLNKVEGVDRVEVDLAKKVANVYSGKKVNVYDLQKALPEKYTIKSDRSEVSEPDKSKWIQLKPLFIIFFYLFTAVILLNYPNFNVNTMMLDFMGLFFIVFSFFKILDVKGFASSFSMYDPIAKRLKVFGLIYPFIEIALGLMFLFRWNLLIAVICTIILLSVTTIGVVQVLMSKKKVKCACLGSTLNLPMTEATFIENAIMLIMAMLMLMNLVSV